MPLYDFQCTRCGTVHEVLQGTGEDAPACPGCGGPTVRLLGRPADVRGQTARPHGRTCCGREERCDAPPCGGDARGCRHG